MSDYATQPQITEAGAKLRKLRDALNTVLFGQERLVDGVIAGLLARGHILLEGLPGLGKTELIKGLGKALRLQAKRIQFTPDLLPGDITGNPMLHDVDGRRVFVFQPGPLFANLVLADEINRASPKTQSALLEAMQERRVTVMGETHVLPDPFFVLATQNPIELEGTYPLPEAQLDRFLFKLDVHRNEVAVLERIVKNREIGAEIELQPVLAGEELLEISSLTRRVFLPDVVTNYIARLVDATHAGRSSAASGIKFGASPRAALGLAAASRARALLEGRLNASFEDVQAMAAPVLQHRIVAVAAFRRRWRAGRTRAGSPTRFSIPAPCPSSRRSSPSRSTNPTRPGCPPASSGPSRRSTASGGEGGIVTSESRIVMNQSRIVTRESRKLAVALSITSRNLPGTVRMQIENTRGNTENTRGNARNARRIYRSRGSTRRARPPRNAASHPPTCVANPSPSQRGQRTLKSKTGIFATEAVAARPSARLACDPTSRSAKRLRVRLRRAGVQRALSPAQSLAPKLPSMSLNSERSTSRMSAIACDVS
jgi:MoxR-like ATPase